MSRLLETQFYVFINYILIFLNGVALLPFFISSYGLQDYSNWLLVSSFFGVLTSIDPGIGSVFEQRVASLYALDKNIVYKRDYYLMIFLSVFIAISTLLLGAFFYDPISSYSKMSDVNILKFKDAYLIGLLAVALNFLYYGLSGIMNGRKETNLVSKINFYANLIGSVFTFCLIYFYNFVEAFAYGLLLKSVISLAFAIPYILIKHFNCREIIVDTKSRTLSLFDYLRTFNFTFFARLCGTLTIGLEASIVSANFSPNLFVAFMILRRLPSTVTSFLSGFLAPFSPYFSIFSSNDIDKHKILLLGVSKIYLLVLVVCFILMLGMNPIFSSLFLGLDFSNSVVLNFFILLPIFLLSLNSFLTLAINAQGNFAFTSKIVIFQSFLIFILFYCIKFLPNIFLYCSSVTLVYTLSALVMLRYYKVSFVYLLDHFMRNKLIFSFLFCIIVTIFFIDIYVHVFLALLFSLTLVWYLKSEVVGSLDKIKHMLHD